MSEELMQDGALTARPANRNKLLAILALVIIMCAVFSVSIIGSGQVGVVIRTGSDQVRVIAKPGIYAHLPFIERVWLIDSRLKVSEQTAPQTYTASDRQAVQIAAWVAWRIADPAKFNELTASGKNPIDEKVMKAFSDVLADWVANQPVGVVQHGQSDQVVQRWVADLNQRLAPLGVQAERAGLRQVGPSTAAADAIFDRMGAARTRTSRQLIEGLANDERQLITLQRRQQDQVLSDAYRSAQQIRQSAENELLAVYTRQYGQANGFAEALRNPPASAEKPLN